MLHNRHYRSVEKIQKVLTNQLKVVSMENFQHFFLFGEEYLPRFVASQRVCFNGDQVDFNKGELGKRMGAR